MHIFQLFISKIVQQFISFKHNKWFLYTCGWSNTSLLYSILIGTTWKPSFQIPLRPQEPYKQFKPQRLFNIDINITLQDVTQDILSAPWE